MKKTAAALAAFLMAAPAYATSNDDGVDYCVHRKLLEQLVTRDVDVKDLFNAVFLPEQVKPFITACQDNRGSKSPRFTISRREYTHVVVRVFGENRTGMMHVVPRYKHQRP